MSYNVPRIWTYRYVSSMLRVMMCPSPTCEGQSFEWCGMRGTAQRIVDLWRCTLCDHEFETTR